MSKVIIVGAGWGGCAAAISARKMGAEVIIVERMDMILGTGLVGGIMRNNGRYTASEEMIAMGASELFNICDNNSRHKYVDFPGHRHAFLYDISNTHGSVMNYLKQLGIRIRLNSRIVTAKTNDNKIECIEDDSGNVYYGDVFIDATGTAGPVKNCVKYGNGCAMCIIRCPSFGGRVSLTGLIGVDEYVAKRQGDSYGYMSGSCKILKESLSKKFRKELNSKGFLVVHLPNKLRENNLDIKVCEQYALKDYIENIILLDTGHAKLMSPYYDIDKLRQIDGFENVRFEDPYAGSKGNSMRFFDIAPRNNYMKVKGVKNLFCCGEKSGLLVGHTEAIVTGTLAGYNSVRSIEKKDLLKLPENLAVGDAIIFTNNQLGTSEKTKKFTFSGSVYFERMRDLKLYTTDNKEIHNRVKKCDLINIFNKTGV